MILNSPYISGSLTVTGNITACGGITISGSVASASYAANASFLNGSGSGEFVPTGSFNTFSSSILTYTGSVNSRLSSIETVTGSNITRLNCLESKTGSYATTGSNTFVGTQTITGSVLQSGSFTTTGTIIAQTINVQTVTSSIMYSSGSNIFGNAIGNTQTFTGSVNITGSQTIFGNLGIGGAAGEKFGVIGPLGQQGFIRWSDGVTTSAFLGITGSTAFIHGNNFYLGLGANGSNNYSPTMMINNGNVGIGTSSPNRLLSMQGSNEAWIQNITTATTAQCWLFGQDGARKGFEVYDANLSATRLFITPTTGNIGISNVCPRSPLSFSNGTGDKIDFYNDGNARYSVQVNSGELRFYTCTSDIISLYAGNTVGLVNRSGKVTIAGTCTDVPFAIGDWCNRGGRLLTSNCAGWASDGVTPCMVITSNTLSTNKAAVIGLALHNDNQACGAYAPALVFSRRSYSGTYNTTMAAILAQSSLCGVDANWAGGDLVFANGVNGGYMSESMRIFSNGDITLGSCSSSSTNSIYWSRGGNEFQINGSYGSNSPGGAGASLRIGDNNSGARRLWMMQLDGSNYFGTFYYNESVGWTKVGYQTTGGTWTNSDERRKENIVDFNYGLKEVLELRPKMFNYKNDEHKIKNLGFIAQQVLPSIPEAVQSDEDDGQQYYAMNYGNLIPVLVKSIQEQQCTINTLKTCLGIA